MENFKPIWPVLFPACVVALAIYIGWSSYPWWHPQEPFYSSSDKWLPLVVGVPFTVIAAGLSIIAGFGVAEVIGSQANQVWRECWQAKMVSMRSADGVEGKISGGIFMMSGSVGSEQIYHYYTLARDGGFKPHKCKADRWTTVYEEDRNGGTVVQFESKFTRPWMAWLGEPSGATAMDFHIPKGSLKQGFTLQ